MVHEVSDQAKAAAHALVEQLADAFRDLPRESEPAVTFAALSPPPEPKEPDE